MMHKQEEGSKSDATVFKILASALLAGLISLNTFGPAVMLMAFGFDTHSLECTEHLHLTDNDETACVLKGLIPGDLGPVPVKTVTVSSFFPKLFFENGRVTTSDLSKTITRKLPSPPLLQYSSPVLGIHPPPPKQS